MEHVYESVMNSTVSVVSYLSYTCKDDETQLGIVESGGICHTGRARRNYDGHDSNDTSIICAYTFVYITFLKHTSKMIKL